MAFHVPEICRVTTGPHGTSSFSGNNGLFEFKEGPIWYRCVVSDGGGWEHVSVSLSVKRTPDWEEMCMIKRMFWDPEDCVVQFHPPEADYVNIHPYVLHLWRKSGVNFETPPRIFV